jgi:hypothetical protein
VETRFMPATLRHWDGLLAKQGTLDSPESLALSFFDDERPLRGAAGLADWRLCGRLSRLIVKGHCKGGTGESLMMPAGPRLPFERIFLFGLGASDALDDKALESHAQRMLDVLQRASVEHYAVQIPGRSTGVIGARRAAEIWKSATSASDCRVTIIDSKDSQKKMGDVLGA